MSWCRLDSDYLRHPKTVALCALLDDPEADRYLARLWSWAAGNCPTGILPAAHARFDFELAARWRGPPGRLFDALVDCRLVDIVQGQALIHDWSVINGHHLRESKRKSERRWLNPEGARAQIRAQARVTDGRTDVQTEITNVVSLPKASGRAKPSGPSPEVEALRKAWNDNRGTLPEWKLTHAKRSKAAKDVLKAHGLEVATEAIRRAAASSFLTGTNDRGWRADVDFLLRPGKLEAVLEGKYDDRRGLSIANNTGSKADFDNDPYFSPTQPKGSA